MNELLWFVVYVVWSIALLSTVPLCFAVALQLRRDGKQWSPAAVVLIPIALGIAVVFAFS